MSSFPFVPISNTFNPADYNILDEGLTIGSANKLYLSLSGGSITGALNVNDININGVLTIGGLTTDLDLLSGITPGIASASKALVVDSNKDIVGINLLQATNFLQVQKSASGVVFQSVNGTSTCSLYHFLNGDQYFGSSTDNDIVLQRFNIGVLRISLTNMSLVSSRQFIVNNTSDLSINTLGGIKIGTNLTMGTTVLSESEVAVLDGVVAGTATANKALITDSGNNILSLGTFSCGKLSTTDALAINQFSGSTQYISPNSSVELLGNASELKLIGNSSVLTGTGINSAVIMNGTNSRIRITANTASSTSASTGSLTSTGGCYFGGNSIFNANLRVNGSLFLGATEITASATEINYLDITTIGVAEASKALVLDSNKRIANIDKISLTHGEGVSFISTAGTSICHLYQSLNGDNYLGTVSNNNFRLITSNMTRCIVNGATGDFTAISSLTALSLKATDSLYVASTVGDTKMNYLDNLSNARFRFGHSLATGKCITFNYDNASDSFSIDRYGSSNNLRINSTGTSITGILSAPSANFTALTAGTISGFGVLADDALNFQHGTPYVASISFVSVELAMKFKLDNSFNFFKFENSDIQVGTVLIAGKTHSVWDTGLNTPLTLSFGYASLLKRTRFLADGTDNIFQIGCCDSYTDSQIRINSANTGTNNVEITKCIIGTNNGTANDSVLNIKGSPSLLTALSYNSCLVARGENASPPVFEIAISAGASSTSTNAVRLGTTSNNDLQLLVNNSTRMNFSTSGINTISTGSLYIPGSSSYSISGTIYKMNMSDGSISSVLGPISYPISAKFGSDIQCSNVYSGSDIRIKKDISDLEDNSESLLKLKTINFKYINDKSNRNQIGIIAQECLRYNLIDLLQFSENLDLGDDEEFGGLENKQMSINYSKLSVLLLQLCQKQQKQIDSFEERLDKLEKKNNSH